MLRRQIPLLSGVVETLYRNAALPIATLRDFCFEIIFEANSIDQRFRYFGFTPILPSC